ncbi:MAG: hypothetical protein JWR26_3622 [Pedosphaera sp.]|nr:hypothetical protein [Pedosphaera sp.]
MYSLYYRARLLLMLVGLSFLVMLTASIATAETPLSADQIVQKAVQRSEAAKTHEKRPDYRYTKHTITDELDPNGRLKDRKEKLYEVLVASGLSYIKLVQANGQSLSPAELKKQQDRELADRQKMTDSKPDKTGDDRENFLTADIVSRYKFTILGQKTFNDRTTYLVAFEPKGGNLPVHKLTDRFLNHVAGTVWIDAQEYEVARVEAHLTAEVSLWGGMIGTLRQCNYTLERTRLADGSWFNSFSHGLFEGRKLLEPMLVRTRSESTNFARANLASK